MKKSARAGIPVAIALLVLPFAGCGDDDEGSEGKETLTVFAAASLTATFEQLEKQFEDAHPDVDVQFNFDGSSSLVEQISSGADADVFASADDNNMTKLVDGDLADGDSQEFATNTLIIAVPPGNPAGITSLADLTKPDLNLVLCQPDVPCGSAAQKLAEAAGITLKPKSEEEAVTGVLTKVESGEADAGLVYVTDVKNAGDKVEGIEFPESGSVVNHYPIVVVEGSDEADLAKEWIELVLGDGQAVFADAGFGPPAA